VLDLAWVAAAPLATRVLAYWGATVVRVESSLRPDLTRVALGHRDDILEVENAITYQLANAGKLGLALNLAVPESRDVVLDLARWADVVVESFTPGTVAGWGLGYDDLRAVNPGIVMLSSCVMGQTGPFARFAGFGNLSASVAGFYDVTGWPDRSPAGPYMAYTDYTSPRFTLLALLAALDHRRRTGEGQYLDFSQMEAATHLLTPALLDLQRTGRMQSRDGNRDPDAAPHGVYPAFGEDAWVAVVCETDEQWRSLAIEMRRPDLAGLVTAERLTRRDELDEVVAAWTAGQDPIGLQYRLQANGVPAHAVQHSGECLADAQLAHRGHFTWLPHPYVRSSIVDTPPHRLSRSPAGYRWAGPTYGQHTEEVLRDLLGYDDDRIAARAMAAALE
jgi:benzylsuccinate CoA-transferase BbsF subunit